MNCEYVQQFYGVPACIGRRVKVYDKPGIIAEDRGHYIGVNFDEDKPGVVHNAHPMDHVEYGEMGKIRPMTRGQARYQRYLEYGDWFNNFKEFLQWDSQFKRIGRGEQI
jgi:hypothetical protein